MTQRLIQQQPKKNLNSLLHTVSIHFLYLVEPTLPPFEMLQHSSVSMLRVVVLSEGETPPQVSTLLRTGKGFLLILHCIFLHPSCPQPRLPSQAVVGLFIISMT